MKYYIQEVYKAKTDQKTAGIKARDDVEEILESLSYRPIVISSIIKDRKDLKKLKKVLIHKETYDIWKKTLSFLKSEDELKTYLYYLDANRLDEFKAFNIIYQVNPL